MANILPRDLPAATIIPTDTAIIIDGGVSVEKATPVQIVDAGAPLATQAQAEAGLDNVTRTSPLRVAQAIVAQTTAQFASKVGISALASDTGAELVGVTAPIANSSTRTVAEKFGDLLTVRDFATPALGDASGLPQYVPFGTTVSTDANAQTLKSRYWGDGQIQTADGNKRGRLFSFIDTRPAITPDYSSIITAFNGDNSRVSLPIEHWITGEDTLGKPATGYLYTPETSPVVVRLFNSSGWNEETASNVGRTGATALRVVVQQYGQGDAMAYNASAFVTGQRAGATSWLANPAAALFCGDIAAGSDGVYLNPREIICHDNGFDVSCVGDVMNMVRTNATGALGVFWSAYRAQNQGTSAPDNVLSAVGEWRAGVDFSMTEFPSGDAVVLAPGQKIVFSGVSSNGLFTTGNGGDFIEYSEGVSGLVFVTNNAARLIVADTQFTSTVPAVIGGTTPSTVAGYLGLGASTAVTAGAASGQYLVISINGFTQKIALLNDA